MRRYCAIALGVSQIAGASSLTGGLIGLAGPAQKHVPLFLLIAEGIALVALYSGVQLIRFTREGISTGLAIQAIQMVQWYSPKLIFALMLGVHADLLVASTFQTVRFGLRARSTSR